MAITQLTKTEFSEKIANLDSAISECIIFITNGCNSIRA